MQTHMGQLLRRRREAIDLTQADVSKFFRFASPQFVSNVERGIASFPIKHANRLAGLLKITTDAIIEAKLADEKVLMQRAVKRGNSKKRVSRL